jgi:hypothetical protein
MAEGLGKEPPVSAGQSARRGGYAYVPRTTPKSSGKGLDDLFSVIVFATLIFVTVAALSDDVIRAAVTHTVGTAWSEAVTLANNLVRK